jgi:hypothetical protein
MKKSVKWVALSLLAIFVISNYPASASHMKGKPKLKILLNWMKKTKKAKNPEQQKFVVKVQPKENSILDLSVFSSMPEKGSNSDIADLVKHTSVISVLFFDGKRITINEHAKRVSEKTLLPSISMAKSITGYLLGHAICEKKIDSLSDTADRYLEVTKGTLYAKRTLRQLINMTNGDGNVNNRDFANNVRTLKKMYKSPWVGGLPPLFNGKDYDFTPSYDLLADRYGTTLSHFLKGTKNLKETDLTFNYGGIPPDIILNIIAKAVGSIEKFTAKFVTGRSGSSHSLVWRKQRDGALNAQNGLYMTREDWLKVSMMINKDWQSDSCIGKYLKNIEENATSASHGNDYGGFFWFNENASMRGHFGQTIVLDRSTGAVLAVHSMAADHDYKSDFGSILPR